jgi:hypothetical protein
MKYTSVLKSYLLVECAVLLSLTTWAGLSSADGVVYRCKGNEYVASIKDSKNGECKPVEGGYVTIVQSAKLNNPPAADVVKVASVSSKTTSSSSGSNSGQRTESSSEQRSRDSDSRLILESELKKSEAKLADLLKEYNNGEPEKNSLEIKNPQRFAERLAEMKANIARLNSDIEGIRRELGRNPGAVSKSN